VRVPVRVVDNDGVSCHQIDAQTTSTRGEQEDEALGGLAVEVVHHQLAVTPPRVAVQAVVLPAAQQQVVLHDVEHSRHLAGTVVEIEIWAARPEGDTERHDGGMDIHTSLERARQSERDRETDRERQRQRQVKTTKKEKRERGREGDRGREGERQYFGWTNTPHAKTQTKG
jgi:hypothetical protein